ncbi:hypothetical protein PM8797T_07412 [Gimesia maris DSM 8797]|nr:hypothetical protein PM8797T_07412 [Gimesia maris DSM 8797]
MLNNQPGRLTFSFYLEDIYGVHVLPTALFRS